MWFRTVDGTNRNWKNGHLTANEGKMVEFEGWFILDDKYRGGTLNIFLQDIGTLNMLHMIYNTVDGCNSK